MAWISSTVRSLSAAKARRSLTLLLTALVLLVAGAWLTSLPVVRAFPETLHLSRLPAPLELRVPVAGVQARRITDTWGEARSGGRRHQGVDIFADDGALNPHPRLATPAANPAFTAPR